MFTLWLHIYMHLVRKWLIKLIDLIIANFLKLCTDITFDVEK